MYIHNCYKKFKFENILKPQNSPRYLSVLYFCFCPHIALTASAIHHFCDSDSDSVIFIYIKHIIKMMHLRCTQRKKRSLFYIRLVIPFKTLLMSIELISNLLIEVSSFQQILHFFVNYLVG